MVSTLNGTHNERIKIPSGHVCNNVVNIHSVVTLHGEAEEHRHIIEWLIFHFPKTITVQPWQTKTSNSKRQTLVRLQLSFKHDLDILDQPDLSHQVVCE